VAEWNEHGTRWWGPDAAEEAVQSFIPVMTDIVQRAYQRAGSPDGPPDTEALERWLGAVQETDSWRDLDREIGHAWAVHLELRFASRQVN
jgi:hypothetical protein